MAVKKKGKEDLDVKEVEAAHAKNVKEVEERERREREAKADALKHADKKSGKKRVEQIVKNDLVKVELTGSPIELETHPHSAVAIPGLMDYLVEGTHLRLLGMSDPTQIPTTEQRLAMARRLNEVGPYLPKYIKHVSLRDGRGLSKEEVEESKEMATHIAEERARKERAPESPTESKEHKEKIRSGKGQPKPKATTTPSVAGGVPLKKLCAEVDIDPKDARRALRSAKIEKPGGRWEWPAEKVDEVKKVLAKAKAELAKEGA